MWHTEPPNPDRDTELKQVHYRAQLTTRIRISQTIKNEMTIAKEPVRVPYRLSSDFKVIPYLVQITLQIGEIALRHAVTAFPPIT